MAGVEETARGIAARLADDFAAYARGEAPFERLTLQAFTALQEVQRLRTGARASAYNVADATESQEELAQEPAREG